MDFLIFALVMVLPVALCLVTVSSLAGDNARRRRLSQGLVIVGTVLGLVALFPLAWPADPLFEGELTTGGTLAVPATHGPLGRTIVFTGELAPGKQQDDYSVEVAGGDGGAPLTTLAGQLEAHQERRKIGRGQKKTITVAHLTRVHGLPSSTNDRALTLKLVSGTPMHVAVRGGEFPASIVLALGLLLALVAGLTEQVPVSRFGTGQKKPAPRSGAAVAAVAIFTAEVTVGAHPPVIAGVLVFAVAAILGGMAVASVVNLFRKAPPPPPSVPDAV